MRDALRCRRSAARELLAHIWACCSAGRVREDYGQRGRGQAVTDGGDPGGIF